MEALGLRTLASSLQNSIEKESSLNLGKQRNKKVHGEGSDSSEYLPGAEEGQEEEDESVLVGCLYIMLFIVFCETYFHAGSNNRFVYPSILGI